MDLDLVIENTWNDDPLGLYTCNYEGRHPANQIDYICSNLPRTAVCGCGVFESDATKSDHRALMLAILTRPLCCRAQARNWYQQRRQSQCQPKPVGWLRQTQ
eukprot:3386285-Karenia_brevis.AAC.1